MSSLSWLVYQEFKATVQCVCIVGLWTCLCMVFFMETQFVSEMNVSHLLCLFVRQSIVSVFRLYKINSRSVTLCAPNTFNCINLTKGAAKSVFYNLHGFGFTMYQNCFPYKAPVRYSFIDKVLLPESISLISITNSALFLIW